MIEYLHLHIDKHHFLPDQGGSLDRLNDAMPDNGKIATKAVRDKDDGEEMRMSRCKVKIVAGGVLMES